MKTYEVKKVIQANEELKVLLDWQEPNFPKVSFGARKAC